MSSDLTLVATRLGGNTLQVGGSGLIAIAVGYGVFGGSKCFVDSLEAIPKVFNDPALLFGMKTKDDGTLEASSDESAVDKKARYMRMFTKYGMRALFVGGILVGGVVTKRAGMKLDSDAARDLIRRIVGTSA